MCTEKVSTPMTSANFGETIPWTLIVQFATTCIACAPASSNGVIVFDVVVPAFSVVQKGMLANRLELDPSMRRPLAANVTGFLIETGVFAGAT